MKDLTTQDSKQILKEMLTDLYQVADKVLDIDKLHLSPGTYRALDIHTILKSRNTHYLDNPLWMHSPSINRDELPTQGCGVFYSINRCERLAGVTGKKVRTWTIPDGRDAFWSSEMTFPSEKTMKTLSMMIKHDRRKTHEEAVLSLSDGCIRNIIPVDSQNHESYCPIKITTKGYESVQVLSLYSFRITPEQLKHIYGTCKISIYKDSVGSVQSFTNPYNVRIVIENCDGWQVALSDVVSILPDYLDAFDKFDVVTPAEQHTKPHPRVANSESVDSLTNASTPSIDILTSEAHTITESISNVPSLPHDTPNVSTTSEKNSCSSRGKRRMKQRERAAMRKTPPFKKKYIEHTVKKLHFSRRKR